MEQIDLTAQPFDRTAALEQENARLRAELAACRNPRSRTTRDPAIAAAPEYLQCVGSDCASSAAEHRLLEATATAANALLTITPFDEAVNAALQMIGEALDTDRVAVIENFDAPAERLPYWRILYEWDSPDAPSQLLHPDATQGRYEDMEEGYERFVRGQRVSYLLEEMPELLRVDLAKVGIKSTHIIPIFVEGKFWGVLGLDDCREARRRSSSELAVLKIAADCIGSAIQRDRTQQALLQAEQARSAELERYNTELQQANEEILEREREKALLLSLSEDMATIRDRNDLWRVMMEKLRPLVGFDDAVVICFSPDGKHSKTLLTVSSEQRQQDEYYQSIINQWIAIIEPLADVYNLKTGYWSTGEMHRKWQTSDFAGFEFMLNQNLLHTYQVILKQGGDELGILLLHFQQQEDIRESKFNLYKAIADQVAVAVANILANDKIAAQQAALLQAEQARSQQLERANEELQQRDRLLSVVAATAKDLLENPNVKAAIAHALQSIGEAASISRMLVMQEKPEAGTGRLQHCVIQEWDAPNSLRQMDDPITQAVYNDDYGVLCDELRAGRSIWHTIADFPEPAQAQQMSIDVKSTGAVPIFIEGVYFGCVGFDDCVTDRQWTPHEIDVLTTGAGAIGAALHRQQLVDRLIAERVQAEQERAAELAKANEALARTSSRLADQPDLSAFLGYVTLEAATQLKADAAALSVLDKQRGILENTAHVQQGQLIPISSMAPEMSIDEAEFYRILLETGKPRFFDLDTESHLFWTGAIEFHRQHNHRAVLAAPLLAGKEFLGHLGLAFTQTEPISEQSTELLQALANQATLAIQLTQLAEEAKQAAIAREQELAAQERAAELAKANDALKQTVDVLATETDLDRFLGHVLQVIATQLDAPLTEYWYHPEPDNIAYIGLTCWQGQILKPEEQPGHVGLFGYPVPPEMIHRESLHQRRSHFITENIATSPVHIRIARESGLDASAWYEPCGVSRLLNVPLILGDKTIGALIVFLPSDRHFTEQQIELTYALAQQVTLAIQLTRLAEEAKQAAIAREQELAAQERAAELERVNALLRDSLAQLSQQSDVSTFLGQVAGEILHHLKAANVFILHYSPVDHTLCLCLFHDGSRLRWGASGEEMALFAAPFSADITPAFELMCRERRMFTPSTYSSITSLPIEEFAFPGGLEWMEQMNVSDTAVTALFAGDQPIGTIHVQFTNGQQMRQEDEAFFLSLTQQAAIALRIADLAEKAKQAAIAREQQQAAQERAAELAKANEALGRSLNRLANERSLNSFLGHVLQEALQMLDGAIAQFFIYDAESDSLTPSVAVDPQGEVLPAPGMMNNLPVSEAFPATITKAWERMLNLRTPVYFDLERDAADYWPGTIDWHRSMGHCGSICTALMLGNQPLGMLGLSLRGRTEFTAAEFEFFQALGQQATLAIQLTQLAEEAKQAAIAREQELAAQERAAELAKANEALKRSLNSLAVDQSLDRFLENVMTALAEQFNSTTAEYWSHPDGKTAYIKMLIWEGKLYSRDSFAKIHPDHPGLAGYTVPPEMVFAEPLNQRTQHFIIEDSPIHPDLFKQDRQWMYDHGIPKEINVPLNVGDHTVGAFVVRMQQEVKITTEKVELAWALANQVALALELTRLAEEAKQAAIAREQEKAAQERVAQLAKANTTLKRTLDILATEPDLDCSLGHVLQVMTEQLDSSSAALWLFNADSNTFSLHLVYLNGEIIPATPQTVDRLAGEWTRGHELPRDLSLRAHIRDRVPVIYDVDHCPDYSPAQRQFMNRLGVKTLLGVPLLLGSTIVGSFTVRFTQIREFEAEELELTQALAHQATLAIQLLHRAEEAKQAALYEERNRLAGEIHDTLAQAFTGISMQLGLAHWLLQQDPTAVAPILDRISELAQTGLSEARRSVWSLYPDAADYADLAQKLSHCVKQWTRDSTIAIDLQILGTPRLLPSMIGQNLLRIGQEAITNALKHAQATTVATVLTYTDQSVTLSVQDDGCGFSPELNNGGFGLISMSERSDRIGGQLSITSQLGRGTEIQVQVPVE